MVDYYLLLSRAVAGIPRSMPNARRALYDRARRALVNDLKAGLAEADLAAEKRSLEEAIARIESETPALPATATAARQLERRTSPKEIDANGGAAIAKSEAPQQPPEQVPPAKRPTLSELLRRVDDAMKEPALVPPRPTAEERKPAPPAARNAISLAHAATRVDDRAKNVVRPCKLSLAPAPQAAPRAAPPRPAAGGAAPPPITLPPVEAARPSSKQAAYNTILKNFQFASPGMEASALISRSGQMIASLMNPEMEEARIAGVTATLLNLCGRAANELSRGEVREIVVRADHGYAVMIGAGHDALLLALANDKSQLGYIFFSMQQAIKSFEKLL
jgi:predicted regulator of Ras-like GTPase activity (Roadblock/LC7/MglB family)